ncbi:unnamed protein product [Arabis nemorensis]|uniref:Inositol-phosphate phosphatase n=1 Tax=Arabis nemorensis TaxID=586526 RepID=A0A565AVQ7_9BRAS|nr:unnamed protein product [Arabis nemorensis]
MGFLLTDSEQKLLCLKFLIKHALSKIGAKATGTISPSQLFQVVEAAAKTGAEVVMEAVNKPRNITYKGLSDLVTDTDKASEAAILEVVKRISVIILFLVKKESLLVVRCAGTLEPFLLLQVVERCVMGKKFMSVIPMLLREPFLSQDLDMNMSTNMELFKEFTDVSRGVQSLGAAAVDMCHVALGIAESYREYGLKTWDMAAGLLIVEEAGGAVTRMDGGKFSVFDRSVLVSNGVIHSKLLERIAPATENLKTKGIDFSLWCKPEDYHTEL